MTKSRMTKHRVSRKKVRKTKRRVSRKNRSTRKRRTRKVVRKNQKGGHLTVANLAVLGALGLWFNGEFDDLLVGPLTDLRPKELKKVLKKGERSLKKGLDISSPLDKAQDALEKALK